MPEIIIEQNKDIINYINMLDLPYSDTIKNNMVDDTFKKINLQRILKAFSFITPMLMETSLCGLTAL